MSNFKKNHLFAGNIALMAILLATEIILSRFLSISLPFVKIGFSFIPVAIAARKMGAPEAMVVAGLGDLLGALLFPVAAYFPGFTLTAIIKALILALFFREKCTIARISAAVVINELIGSILLNTLWLSVLFGTPFLALIPTRLLPALIMVAVQISVLWLIFSKAGKFLSPKKTKK